jgi:cytochrome c-type biogenesis protein CcmH
VTRRTFPLWTAFGAVLVVALVIGSGVLSSAPPTAAQRAYAIESVVRCPSCEDLSVAVSSAPTAVTVRATVRQLIAEGRTDRQIEDYLVARYGSSIVLDPPASGWSLLLWLLPLLGGAAALMGMGMVLVRRRGAVATDAPGPADPGAASLDPVVLVERRRFLTQSLADADAEYLAGDLSDPDYLALRQRDLVRLAALDAGADATAPDGGRAPSEGNRSPDGSRTGAPASSAPGRPTPGHRSWWFLGGAVAAFGAALIVAVTLFASHRLPGQTSTGSISLSQGQQVHQTLNQAATLENQGQLGQAAQLYQSVLNSRPDNEVALAQLGWLEYETGRQGASASLIDDARAKLNRALQLDPGDYAVRLYLGTVLLQQDGDAAGAVDQFRQFLADNPPATVVHQAAGELRAAYQKAGLPVPPQVGSG